jgi:hypothetical protein
VLVIDVTQGYKNKLGVTKTIEIMKSWQLEFHGSISVAVGRRAPGYAPTVNILIDTDEFNQT